jgi:hypothetical protein
MKNFLKSIKKNIDFAHKNTKTVLDENGRAVIEMSVNNDDNFLSNFCCGDSPVISGEVSEFLENSYPVTQRNLPIKLRIKSNCIDLDEKVVYEKAIRKHYTDRYLENERHLKRNFFFAILLGLVGLVVMALAIILESAHQSVLWVNFIDVIAWVFIWEFVDIIFFENYVLRLNRIRYLSFIDMQIEFILK